MRSQPSQKTMGSEGSPSVLWQMAQMIPSSSSASQSLQWVLEMGSKLRSRSNGALGGVFFVGFSSSSSWRGECFVGFSSSWMACSWRGGGAHILFLAGRQMGVGGFQESILFFAGRQEWLEVVWGFG